jgi:hypothetical protein
VTRDYSAEDVLAALARDPLPSGPYLVCAASARHAQLWARGRGVSPQQWRYLPDASGLLGLGRDSCVVVVNHQLPSGPVLHSALRMLQLTGTTIVYEST